MENYAEAIRYYEFSLAEHRSPDTVNRLNQVCLVDVYCHADTHKEIILFSYCLMCVKYVTYDVIFHAFQIKKMLKEKEALAYLDKDKAEEERLKGNDFFSKGNFPDAVKHYTEALKRNPSDERIYSNRAACYTKLAEFRLAIKVS